MSVTSLLLDNRVPSVLDGRVPFASGRPERKPEGETKGLSASVAVPGKREEHVEEQAEVRQEQSTEPVINVLQSQLEFTEDEQTGRIIIKMYDRQSGELIRQIPPEDVLAFLRQLAEDRKGILVSRRL